MSDAAIIEQPEGSPGAVADAGSSLQRVAGGFERGGGIVARASTSVSAWEGRASVSFDGRAASYGLAMVAVEQVLTAARGAVRRYETKLEDARAKIRELREQEDMAVARLERAKGQLKDAQGKLAGARDRMSAVSVSGGLGDPFSMGEQVQAGRDADQAQADIDAAQKQIDREREEIGELRKDAKREETELIEAEDTAAAVVRAAAARLPDIQLPGGAASPSAYAGTPFGGPLALDPRWASAMQNAAANEEPDENGGNLGDFLSGAINEGSFGLVDLGGDKDSGAYKGGQGASYIPWNPVSALKSAGTGIVKGGAKVLGKEGAEEAAETGVKKSADDVAGAGGRGGGGAPKAGSGQGRSTGFVTTPRGTTFDVPKGWSAREADNGKGIVYQRPGATGNADMIRIMEPTSKYPNGHFRYYNEHGQPLAANGKPGPNSATHFPEDYEGPTAGWPR